MRISDWSSDVCSSDLTARRAEGRQAGRSEGEAFGSAGRMFDGQPVARQRLAADDVAQVVGEVLEGRERARLGVKVGEVEAPDELLAATVLAHEPIKPALTATGQVEIGAVERQRARVVDRQSRVSGKSGS